MDANVLKTLKDLQYRIDVSDPKDPERENAIRLCDKLCMKYGIDPSSLSASAIEERYYRCQTRDEAQVVVQYAFEKLHREKGEFGLSVYKQSRYGKKLFELHIPMSEDEYKAHDPIIVELLLMYRRRHKAYEAELRRTMARQIKAWECQFLESAKLLSQPDPTDEAKAAKPKWGLAEAMAAAKDLDGAIFPENYLSQQQKALAQSV